MTEPATPADLLLPGGCVADLLGEALRHRRWVDAYLLAAGITQLVDDRLHPDPLLLHRAASYLRTAPRQPARLAGALAGAGGAALSTGQRWTRHRLARLREPLDELTHRLAGQVLAPQTAGVAVPALLLAAARSAAMAVADDRIRLPACFHSFDQHPDDVRWLADAVTARHPDPGTPLCVVGVRTSGSYLAPLHAAALRSAGRRVTTLTHRPGRPFTRREHAVLRAAARVGGLVLVVDDPPASGTSLAATAHAITGTGVPRARVVLLLSLLGDADTVPAALRDWSTVVQPWTAWSVHRRLAPEPVQTALTGMLGPRTRVAEVRPIGPPYRADDRGHLRARFTVLLVDEADGRRERRQILVEGVGLGYLGRQAMVVARALPEHVPRVYGVVDGLLYRDWLPDPTDGDPGDLHAGSPTGPARRDTDPAPDLARLVAGYVDARRRALPAPSASLDGLGGRDPVWEVVAKVLAGQYGRLAVPARPLLLEPLVRRLLVPAHPTVLDGKTDVRHWLPDPAAGGAPRKVDFHQRSFGHLDLVCYDPVCDLAGAAADPPTPAFVDELRRAYERLSGERVDSERMLLYRLGQLRRLAKAGDRDPSQIRRLSAVAVHDYLADLFLRDLPPPAGPLCALDLDGVLEGDRLGFPAASPTGVLALRALIAHGYRPVIVTGRSLTEVRDRCVAFGLVGGVAEYGAALWHDDVTVDLRPPHAVERIDEIRTRLADRPDVQLDPGHRHAIRARCRGGPLPVDVLRDVHVLDDPQVRVVTGDGQTDIAPASVDKGTGLAALAARLGAPECVLAVGDSTPDRPMLARAAIARVPRHARFDAAGVDASRTRRRYQAGLVEACADLLGHRPGHCPSCRPAAFPPRTRTVLALLDLRSRGLTGVPAGTLRALLAACRRWPPPGDLPPWIDRATAG